MCHLTALGKCLARWPLTWAGLSWFGAEDLPRGTPGDALKLFLAHSDAKISSDG